MNLKNISYVLVNTCYCMKQKKKKKILLNNTFDVPLIKC